MANVDHSPVHLWSFPRNLVNEAGADLALHACRGTCFLSLVLWVPTSPASLMELPPGPSRPHPRVRGSGQGHNFLASVRLGKQPGLSTKDPVEPSWAGACFPNTQAL